MIYREKLASYLNRNRANIEVFLQFVGVFEILAGLSIAIYELYISSERDDRQALQMSFDLTREYLDKITPPIRPDASNEDLFMPEIDITHLNRALFFYSRTMMCIDSGQCSSVFFEK